MTPLKSREVSLVFRGAPAETLGGGPTVMLPILWMTCPVVQAGGKLTTPLGTQIFSCAYSGVLKNGVVSYKTPEGAVPSSTCTMMSGSGTMQRGYGMVMPCRERAKNLSHGRVKRNM